MDNTWRRHCSSNLSTKASTFVAIRDQIHRGHSDAMLGLVTCATEELWHMVKSSIAQAGVCAGSEEVFLGLRGLRTLSVRLRQHQDSGLVLASWLDERRKSAG